MKEQKNQTNTNDTIANKDQSIFHREVIYNTSRTKDKKTCDICIGEQYSNHQDSHDQNFD